jgi:hypothetical protein
MSAGSPGVLPAANGLRTALTTPDTNLPTTTTTLGSNGFGIDTGSDSTGDDWIEAIRSDAVPGGCVETVRGLAPTVSVASVCGAVAGTVDSCLVSTVADAGAGAVVLMGRTAAASDFFFVARLLTGPSGVSGRDGAAVSPGCAAMVVCFGSFFVRPPVAMTTPVGAERTASPIVFEPVVEVPEAVVMPDEPASPLVALGADAVWEPVLAAVEAAVPLDSSAHARPLFHPVTIAAPTPKATTKPPTRPTHASLGIRYVYRLRSLGVPECEKPAVCRRQSGLAAGPTELSRT